LLADTVGRGVRSAVEAAVPVVQLTFVEEPEPSRRHPALVPIAAVAVAAVPAVPTKFDDDRIVAAAVAVAAVAAQSAGNSVI